MKLITGIIRPFKLDEVRRALLRFGHVAAITEVKAFTPRRNPAGEHAHEADAFFSKIKIEVVVPTEEAERAVEILRRAALTGRLGEGDGVIFTSTVEHAVRIRTGAADDEAL